MKIIIKNSADDPVFTLDIERGTATANIPMNQVALEFLTAMEVLLGCASSPVKDVSIRGGKGGDASGDLIINMGDAPPVPVPTRVAEDPADPNSAFYILEDGSAGDVTITNPVREPVLLPCPDCKNGTYQGLGVMDTCRTCNGTSEVTA